MPTSWAPRVDRDRFLVLVAAIGAGGCSDGRASARPAKRGAEGAPVVAGPPAVFVATAPATTGSTAQERPAEPTTAPAGACDNDASEPIDCAQLERATSGPACEEAGQCELHAGGYAYRPRVAAAIVRCYESLGAGACDIYQRKKCILQAIKTHACPEAAHEASCDEVMAKCRAAGQTPTYTKAECVLVLSAEKPRDAAWSRRAMGPTREGCRLRFTVF